MSVAPRVYAVASSWLLALLLGAGCGGSLSVTHVLTGPPLAAKPDSAILPVYFNQAPPVAYREIAQIRVRSSRGDATLDRVMSAATEDARELGADAIIADVRSQYHSVEVRVDCQGHPSAPPVVRLNARVTAIVFTPPLAASPEAAPIGPRPESGCQR